MADIIEDDNDPLRRLQEVYDAVERLAVKEFQKQQREAEIDELLRNVEVAMELVAKWREDQAEEARTTALLERLLGPSQRATTPHTVEMAEEVAFLRDALNGPETPADNWVPLYEGYATPAERGIQILAMAIHASKVRASRKES
jgi:hypothetical protein